MLKHTLAYILLLLFVFFVSLDAQTQSESENLDELLNEIQANTDLSEKTKIENVGVSFIYTRSDLERMQAKNLKDVLKSAYPYGYSENAHGFPDPLNSGSYHPFMSSQMRVFIDNQEITTGYFGSGLFVIGDIDIDFVDHIEIYTQNPTYEYSTEPTFILIKLYSKVAQKDMGGKVRVALANRNTKSVSGYYSDELDEWSYFAYMSYDDDNKRRYENEKYSKDKEEYHLFGSLYNEKNHILLEMIHQNRDNLFTQNFNLNFKDNYIDADYLHIGYDTNIGDFYFLASYDYYRFHQMYYGETTPTLQMIGIPYRVEMTSKSNTYSLEAKYKHDIENNKLVAGIKYRYKDYRFPSVNIDYVEIPKNENTSQTYVTAFLENQYRFLDNAIFTSSASYSNISTNNDSQNDDLFMYRFGLTYTTKNLVSKTVYSHFMNTIDPVYIDSSYYVDMSKKIEPSDVDTIMENIIYTVDRHKVELILGYMKQKKMIFPSYKTQTRKLCNVDDTLYGTSVSLRGTYNYNKTDKLYAELTYINMEAKDSFGKFIDKRFVIRNLNTYAKFDIFNELIFERLSSNSKNYYDYSLGVKYHHTDDLTFSIKGENVFDKAKKDTYILVDPNTLQPSSSVDASSVEQRFWVSMEYLF